MIPRCRNVHSLFAAAVTPLLLLACHDAVPTGLDQAGPAANAANPNPRVLPRQAKPFGRSYEEWAMAYRRWWAAIPLASNPSTDETGEFCGEGQSGHVWFLASRVEPGSSVRECQVPTGKALYVPLIGIVAWGPDDLSIAEFIVETFLGLDPTELSDEQLIRAVVNWWTDGVTVLSLTVDGVVYDDLFSYRAESPAFNLTNTTFLSDRGLPISHPNLTVAGGFALILAPLPPGAHTIEIHAETDNPLLGHAIFDVTYHLTVVPRHEIGASARHLSRPAQVQAAAKVVPSPAHGGEIVRGTHW